jgi:hypothetical protein
MVAAVDIEEILLTQAEEAGRVFLGLGKLLLAEEALQVLITARQGVILKTDFQAHQFKVVERAGAQTDPPDLLAGRPHLGLGLVAGAEIKQQHQYTTVVGLAAHLAILRVAQRVLQTGHLRLSKAARAAQVLVQRPVLEGAAAARLTAQTP